MSNRIAGFVLLTFLCGASRADAQFGVPSQPVPGEHFAIELAAMFWRPTPELRGQTGALSGIGDAQVDFVQEFGIENERFREFRIVVKPARKHKLRVTYLPVSYTHDTTLQQTITFGDRTFEAGTAATAALDWTLWRLGYEYDFFAGERALLGIIAELNHNRVAAGVEAPPAAAVTEARVLMPALGVIARAYLHRSVSITTEFTGFRMPSRIRRWISDGEIETTFRDFDIYATASVSRHFGIQGGYRSLAADYVMDQDSGELKLKGIYFGAMIRF